MLGKKFLEFSSNPTDANTNRVKCLRGNNTKETQNGCVSRVSVEIIQPRNNNKAAQIILDKNMLIKFNTSIN